MKGTVVEKSFSVSNYRLTPTPIKIVIKNPPTRTTYETGDLLDMSGIVVEVIYNDSSIKDITNEVSYSPPEGTELKRTDTKVTISYTLESNIYTASWPINVSLKIVSWHDGSDIQIVDMVDAADNGEITLSDYWSVGDERSITLGAMKIVPYRNISEESFTFILLNAGGKELVNPTPSGRTTCSFIVGPRESIYPWGMNIGNSNASGWAICTLRYILNSVYYSAIPSKIRTIFKLHKNDSPNGASYSYETPYYTTEDYLCIPSAKEVVGNYFNNGEQQLNQFTYYKTTSNRIKPYTPYSSSRSWWTRTLAGTNGTGFAAVEDDGYTMKEYNASAGLLVCPFGVI